MTQTLPIAIPKDKIEKFCQRYHIHKLSLFGSVLRDDFRFELPFLFSKQAIDSLQKAILHLSDFLVVGSLLPVLLKFAKGSMCLF